MENNKPVKSYKSGAISLNLWENEIGNEKVKSYSFQRSYKDKDDKWQHTQTLKTVDLLKLMVLLEEAYRDNAIIENSIS